MSGIIKFFFGLIIAFTLPIAFFLLSWWSSLLFTINYSKVAAAACAGLVLGFIIDFIILKARKYKIYLLPQWMLITVYSLYSVYIFGFFMGVPIFNLILGIIAGYYWAQRISFKRTSSYVYKKSIKRVAIFTAIWMGIICVLSATFAFMDQYTISNLKGMLNLSLSKPQLITYTIFGGIILVLFQYWLTMKVMTLKLYKHHKPR